MTKQPRRASTLVSLLLGLCSLALFQLCFSQNVTASPDARLLIIEAEDLGMAHSIDKACFGALEKGWVTSAGVLVPAPWFPEVVRWARNHPNTDLGIQLDLNSDWSSCRWRPVSSQPQGSSLVDPAGYLPNTDAYVARHAKPEEVEAEVRAQIDLSKRAGVSVSHIDNHMRVLTATPALFQTYWKIGEETNLPVTLPKQLVQLRGTLTDKQGVYRMAGIDVDIQRMLVDQEIEMMPGFSQRDWLSAYEKTLDALPPGVYLLSVHLGYNDEELQAMTVDHLNWGAQWRQNDFDVVSSPEFQKFLKDKGFILVGWKELEKRMAEQKAGAN